MLEKSAFRLVGDNLIRRDSHAFRRLLPFLRDFPSEIGEIRMLTLELANGDPILAAVSVSRLRSMIMAETAMENGSGKMQRGAMLLQECSLSETVRIRTLLPGRHNRLRALDLAHLAAHLCLPLVRFASDEEPPLTYERTLRDPEDKRLIRIVYGSSEPMIGEGELSAFMRLVLGRLNQMVYAGEGGKLGALVVLLRRQRQLHIAAPSPIT